jgi:CubicO group peptidase (beta-lactamase class C family)
MQSYDSFMISLLTKWHVPGAALAVGYKGRLVFARGYGYADLDQRMPVEPNSLFRIASISKPFTAVAILKLVEEGRLSLDDRAFNILGLQPPSWLHVTDPRIWNVTIRELLNHSGGWDRDKTFDPMFNPFMIAQSMHISPPPSCNSIIQYMMAQRLQYDPGTQYAYSNFGYCILGRVIERITGQHYEDFVRSSVLVPMGITDMRVGHTLPTFRAPGEVHYYDFSADGLAAPVFSNMTKNVAWPYGGFYLEAMDSHGGWIASAIDLVRFAMSVDGAKPPAFLKPETLQMMLARPALPLWPTGQNYYALGWSVNNGNWFHAGLLPGSTTLLVRPSYGSAYSGVCWAVVFNTWYGTDENNTEFSTEFDNGLWQALSKVTSWPSWDLFNSNATSTTESATPTSTKQFSTLTSTTNAPITMSVQLVSLAGLDVVYAVAAIGVLTLLAVSVIVFIRKRKGKHGWDTT